MNPSPTPLSSSEIQDYKSKTIHDEPLQQSPEGSFKAWCTLIGGFLAITAVFASAQAVSWIGSTQLALMVALGLPAVKLLDLGYFKVLTVIGSTIYVFSIFMLSIAHTSKYYQLFLSQGLAAGLGAGLVYVPVLAVQSHHWRRLRPVAMGIVITRSSVGGIIFPIMLNNLFANPNVGFAWGVRASAFVCLGLLIVANILMTANPPKTRKADPPKLGVLFTDGAYIFGVLGAAVADWGLFFPYFYLQLFAMVKGADPTFSFYLLAIFNGSSIPGRIIPNVLSQKFGVFNTMTFCTFACGILIFGLFGVDNSVAALVIFAILYGFFSGGFISLLAPAVASLVKDESERREIRLGFAYCIASLGILTGNPIAGALLGETFPWWRRIVFGAVMLLVGVVLIFITRSIRARQIGSQWV
ncbi:MFS general substrate transporter [Lentinula aciculospora]|uniref:MFS general substrate transporter n=1 Tax=Lentinula aciculospora TaxID=153920 RepID=A0A9W8ZY36_9AGAR|nr:MFS general substrate transporter [Lentinula aciculospora]